MIFYFTGTGNSLYAAKHFDKELYSIPREMKKESRKYTADRIGIVCPLYEFDLPSLVKDFILTSEFETEYFYIVMTYGMHHGGCAARRRRSATRLFRKRIPTPATAIRKSALRKSFSPTIRINLYKILYIPAE